MKTVFNVVLGLCALALVYVCYRSIMGPIEFDNEKKVKEEPKKSSSAGSFEFDVDDLDIPAFLRRKD